jgi:hypothetical protein
MHELTGYTQVMTLPRRREFMGSAKKTSPRAEQRLRHRESRNPTRQPDALDDYDSPADLAANVLQTLGVDPSGTLTDALGRPFPVNTGTSIPWS